MTIEETIEKLQSKEGLVVCGHNIKLIPSISGVNDLVMSDEGRYIVRGVDEYTLDFGEEKGIIFGAFNVRERELPCESRFSFIYDLNKNELYRFDNTYMLTNIGFDEPVGVFGNRLMTFDLEKKEWIPKIEIPNTYNCRTTPDGILYLAKPFCLREVRCPQIIRKDFQKKKAPHIYVSKYLWGLLRKYMSCGARCDEELAIWTGLRIPKKNSISKIRVFIKTREKIYRQNRISAFEELLDILTEYGVKDSDDITELLLTLVSISFKTFKDGVFLGFPNKIFNTFFRRILDEHIENQEGELLSLNKDIEKIKKIFAPYVYWTEERLSELEIASNNPFFSLRGHNSEDIYEGAVGRLCFDVETKTCNIKYKKNIDRAHLDKDYLIKTIENLREEKESSKYMYADIAYNILTKKYVVSSRSSVKITDCMIADEVSMLSIKKGNMDFSYKSEPLSDYYTEGSEKDEININDVKFDKYINSDGKVYIGFANSKRQDRLVFQKYTVSEGEENDGVWNVFTDDKKDYVIGYCMQKKRHIIRSEDICLDVLNALKKIFGIKKWTWEREEDEAWKENLEKA